MVFYFFIFHLDIFILFSYNFYKLTDVTRKFIVTLKELPLGSSLLVDIMIIHI